MANSNTSDQRLIFTGLGTFNTTVTVAGDYVVQGSITLPLARDGSPSSVVAVVMHNASSAQAAGTAGATGYRVLVPAVAAGDTLGVRLTSAAAADNALNAVQTQMQVYLGDV